MRALAIIFSASSMYYLFRLSADALGFIPLGGGFEGGVIVFVGDGILGIGASLLALLFAFIDFHRTRRVTFWRFILAFCCLLIFGFVMTFVFG
jgi:hypothetical protein